MYDESMNYERINDEMMNDANKYQLFLDKSKQNEFKRPREKANAISLW